MNLGLLEKLSAGAIQSSGLKSIHLPDSQRVIAPGCVCAEAYV